MIRILFCLILAIMGSCLQGQSNSTITSDTLKAREYRLLGDSLRKVGAFTNAISNFNQAESLYAKHKLWEDYLTVKSMEAFMSWRIGELAKADSLFEQVIRENRELLNGASIPLAEATYAKAAIALAQGKFETAIDLTNQALLLFLELYPEIHDQVSKCYNLLGIIYVQTGAFDKAKYYFQKDLKIIQELFGETHEYFAQGQTTMAQLHWYKTNYDSSLFYTNRALKVYLDLSPKHPGLANVYNSLGLLHRTMEHHDLALEYFAKSRSLHEQEQSPSAPIFVSHYLNTGGVYYKKLQYDSAKSHYQRALDIASEIFDGAHPDVATLFNNLALVFENTGEYDKSRDFYEKALQEEKAISPQNELAIAQIYLNLGRMYRSKEGDIVAIKYITKALEMQQALGQRDFPHTPYKNRYLVEGYNLMTDIYLIKKQWQKALWYNQKSLIHNVYQFSDSLNLFEVPTSMLASYEDRYLASLEQKAEIAQAIFTQTDSIHYLKKSLQASQAAYSLIDNLRKSQSNIGDIINVGDDVRRVSEIAIQTCLSLFKHTGNQDYLQEAFQFSEKNRAFLLQQALRSSEARQFANIPEALTRKEEETRVNISFQQSNLLQQQDSLSQRETKNQLFDLNRSYDSLIKLFENDYPEYYQLKYDLGVSSVSEVQMKLKPNEVLLEYFRGDGSLLVFGLTNKRFEVMEIKDNTEVTQAITALVGQMGETGLYASDAVEEFTKQAGFLYQTLLSPMLNKIATDKTTSLVIIPDAELNYIPFSALITEPVLQPQGFRNLPYLMERYNISQSYSATLNTMATTVSPRFSKKQVLGIAPSYTTMDSVGLVQVGKFRDDIGELKYNIDEVIAISKNFDGEYLLADAALEHNFKKNINEYSIVHLAAHALIDDASPMNSKIVFTQSKDEREDGFLHAFELYKMDLKPELVVLSACNSGSGLLQRGEGIMSLSRAFAYAGVPSLVASHWQVDDQSTSVFMQLFYEELAKGQGKANALRNAQISFLKTTPAATTHPFYWAGFSLIGDPSPIVSKRDNALLYVLIGLIGLPLVIFLIRRRRRT